MAYSSKRIGFDVGSSRHSNIPESFICFTTNCLFHSSYGIISVCWYCLSLEDQTSTCFFVDAFSYYVCPEKSRNLRPGGQFRQLVPSRKTFWQWWQIEINHARRKIKWGVIGSLVEFAPIMFSSVGWQLLWNKIWSCIFPLDTMTKGSSFKFYIWRDFQVQKQKNSKMISSQKEN